MTRLTLGQYPDVLGMAIPSCPSYTSSSSNRDLDLDTSLDVDDDLLDDLGGRSQVDQALVDAHLVRVPCLGTLTAGGLAGLFAQPGQSCLSFFANASEETRETYSDLEGLGGQADGALGAEVLVLGALNELLADLLERLHLARGQGDTDLVNLL